MSVTRSKVNDHLVWDGPGTYGELFTSEGINLIFPLLLDSEKEECPELVDNLENVISDMGLATTHLFNKEEEALTYIKDK